ncbi:MAG TPA: 3-phosphoshikimate 1-carboxyvinyltransferase [Actinomycetota bacterium]|nr:3-phosphoshikimate 1-carboxyvinyltransferase [Actinomycetota bacterium]
MRLVVHPGAVVQGRARVPGDKSIAHRWLILAATARGRSRVLQVPPSLDVRSTAACMAAVVPEARPGLDAWALNVARGAHSDGFTWGTAGDVGSTSEVEVESHGRGSLGRPGSVLDCGNSGTTMRLLSGLLAAAPFSATLTGDESLRRRPMDRVAQPLRAMGATIETTDGHAPVTVRGGLLRGISYHAPMPSAQLKSAILLAGCDADGLTEVIEAAATRDHTERALEALGGPVVRSPGRVAVSRFQHEGFDAAVPGDVSSAAFLAGAAAVTGGEIEVLDVGLNPSRTGFLEVLQRMGVAVETFERRTELGEPVGDLIVHGPSRLRATSVSADELPLVIDEVPLLAAVAAHASGDTWFAGAGELRVKESDRLTGTVSALRAIGSHAGAEGEDLVVAGGGVRGGTTSSAGDHRMAMATAVAGLAADGDVVVEDADATDISFPGFADVLRAAGAHVETS